MPARLPNALLALAVALIAIPATTASSFGSGTLTPGFGTVTVGYDPVYDAPSTPMSAVACSDGARGLLSLGFPTFGSLPGFPRVGGVSAVAAWNSSACATCWELRYVCLEGRAKEHAKRRRGSGEGEREAVAMNDLTCGHAVQLGIVQAEYRQVNIAMCGL
ncbi:Cerato-platanin-domain-containing protein [Schizophyllum fasciatum]